MLHEAYVLPTEVTSELVFQRGIYGVTTCPSQGTMSDMKEVLASNSPHEPISPCFLILAYSRLCHLRIPHGQDAGTSLQPSTVDPENRTYEQTSGPTTVVGGGVAMTHMGQEFLFSK